MCGLFGVALSGDTTVTPSQLKSLTADLLAYSESRGKEAAGLAAKSNEIVVYKSATRAKNLLKTDGCRRFLKQCIGDVEGDQPLEQPIALLGHSRLVTNGFQGVNENNQPCVRDGIVGVHNGIIVNDQQLWLENQAVPSTELDSEVIFYLLRHYWNETQDMRSALHQLYKALEGMASIACFFEELPSLLLATNNGSLYCCQDDEIGMTLFASEAYTLEQVLAKFHGGKESAVCIQALKPNQACLIDLQTAGMDIFGFNSIEKPSAPLIQTKKTAIIDLSLAAQQARQAMRRCSRCVLPETMPFIHFDEQGVCNYCHHYQKTELLGKEALEERIAPFRKSNSRADCIFALSGGRDSSFGLHYVKKVLGMRPVAFTYDWGMVTDLARRNQSRLCGALGVEHIIISADLRKKRQNIRRNVVAWLKRPELGMVPLFMAGDKQYIVCPVELRKRVDAELVFFCRNQLEKTGFKTGFCGVNEGGRWYYQVSLLDKIKLIQYYGMNFLKNPAYFNPSFLDTLAGFYASFWVDRSNYAQLYNYIAWDEKQILSTLADEYDWELAEDTNNSWRIGDGTAAFYNYIYYTIAGFSEVDTFRSNQVREGLLARQEALKLVEQENQPRYDAIREYTRLIGLDCDEALFAINNTPKLYMRGKE